MRFLLILAVLGLAMSAWADGCTTYGAAYFNRIQETDQVAVVRMAPEQVTLDMFIGIDGIPAGETVTYVLPFWQRPDGFSMEAMKGEDFRKNVIYPLQPQFRQEIRRANRTAVGEMIGQYPLGGMLAFAPLSIIGVLFPVFSKAGLGLQPYSSYATANGSAELFKVSSDQDFQALVARAGLPEKYAKVLRRYNTAYYAVMRLHGTKEAAEASQGLHFHFTHRGKGEEYTYIYPLGTGGAWAKPIALTEVYVTCPDNYYLTASAPKVGKSMRYWQMMSAVNSQVYAAREGKTGDTGRLPTATAKLLAPTRYATAWHTAYLMSNPTEDITIRIRKKPHNIIYQLTAAWRDSDLMPVPFIVLGFLGAMFLSAKVNLRRAWVKAGEQVEWRDCAYDYYKAMLAPAAVLFVGYMLPAIFPNQYIFFLIPACMALALWLWSRGLDAADAELPDGTMKRVAWFTVLWYLALYPAALLMAGVLDWIVLG